MPTTEQYEEKYIKLTFENGMVYGVPLDFIAANRARNYADDPDSNYDDEVNYVMNDPYEGADWLQNNMNWEDIKDVAFRIEVEEPELDFNELFRNAETKIIEV